MAVLFFQISARIKDKGKKIYLRTEIQDKNGVELIMDLRHL